MAKRIAAIVFIFACTSAAWMILGATIWARTDSFDSQLKRRVASIWGTPQTQCPPTAKYTRTETHQVETEERGQKQVRTIENRTTNPLPLDSSRVDVAFDLEHRQKGLLWYSTYKVAFGGRYTFRNSTGADQLVTFTFPFPSSQAVYDDLKILIDGEPAAFANNNNAAVVNANVAAGRSVVLDVGYRSQGLDSWAYSFGDDVAQVHDFSLNMRTNFKRIDFPDNTLSPTDKRETPAGWELTWRYSNLVSGFHLGMTMPQKLQPGPLAGKISFFAPVSLFFFFFLMFIISTLRGIELHPMNYFFLACAFFAFHLLMAYSVDHISIHLAFVICSAVSIFLVVSYLRLAVGMRFAAVEAGVSQFIYLVLFSYAFFFEGFTGLAVTIGSIVTLFVVMQMTGKIRWAEKFSPKPLPPQPLRPATSAGSWLG